MIFLYAIAILVVAPALLVVVGMVWLWLGHKLLAVLLGGRC